MNRLEALIANIVFRQYPTLAASIRELKRRGVSKLSVRDRVIEMTQDSDLMQRSLMIAIDAVWLEPTKERVDNAEET